MRITKPDDIAGLVPSFRRKVELLLEALRRRGYNPVVVDGRRTLEEALANSAKGTGTVSSMHRWGCAADIADRDTGWSDHGFFDALGQEAKKLGLTWGGSWEKPDRPHVQATPATRLAQGEIRLCMPDDVAAVDAICRRYLLD